MNLPSARSNRKVLHTEMKKNEKVAKPNEITVDRKFASVRCIQRAYLLSRKGSYRFPRLIKQLSISRKYNTTTYCDL